MVDDRHGTGPAAALPRRAALRQACGLGATVLGMGAGAGGLFGLSGCASAPPLGLPAGTTVPPFSSSAAGEPPPERWEPYVMRPDKPHTVYRSVQDGVHTVLHAVAPQSATGLRCHVRIDPRERSQLRFSWRVTKAPREASVEAPERDDCPARLILGFDGDITRLSLRDRLLYEQVELFTGHRLPFATLMYVWDGELPVDSLTRNHRTHRIQYLTVESGEAHVGQWLHYQRDIAADYQRVFGEPPGMLTSLGVLTDSDALKLHFEAWYGDITLTAAG